MTASGGFDIPDAEVLYVQRRVYRELVVWLTAVGVLMVASPVRRYGNAYQFITEIPSGTTVFGVIYLACALITGLALRRNNTTVMGRSLFLGALLNWTLGVFLLAGSIAGPTGVLGAPFCLYVGRHMFIHSALFSAQKRRRR